MSDPAIELTPHRNYNPAASGKQFMTVPVAIVAGLARLPCDFYIQPAGSNRKVLYRSAESDIPIGAEDKLDQRHFRHLYMRIEDQRLFYRALHDALSVQPASPTMHLALTLEQHRESFQLAFKNMNVARVVAAAEQIANDLLQIVKRDDFSVGKVVSLLDHDQCTFQHSCNVSIYSATLAQQIGMSESDIELLTTGGLLHDIGKRQIPGYILRKPGRLDNRERELIRQHPSTGFRELAALNKLNWGQLMMTYQHHEWFNGSGYPVGIGGDRIHLWSRICAIADVFDALTANRPYRETDQVDIAMAMMSKKTGHFDPELFALWNQVVYE